MKLCYYLFLLSLTFVAKGVSSPNGYVSNFSSGTVTVFDANPAGTYPVLTNITVGGTPYWVSVSPDGTQAWVSNSNASLGSAYVSVIDTSSNQIIHTVAAPTNCQQMAFNTSGTKIYLSSNDSSNNQIYVVDTATYSVTPITVGLAPKYIALTPDGSKVYVTNSSSGTVSVINASTNVVTSTITVGTAPFGVVVTPDGLHAYVGNNSSGNVSVIDTTIDQVVATIPTATSTEWPVVTPDGSQVYVVTTAGSVYAISTATNTVTAIITVGSVPRTLAMNPNGSQVFVPNNGGGSVTISAINTKTNATPAPTITVGSQPHFITFSSDGTHAYVPNQGGTTLSVIDTVSYAVVASVPVGSSSFVCGLVPGPLPPSTVRAKQKINQFGTLYEYYNQISWAPSNSPNVVQYAIFRNGNRIGTVNANTLQYTDHDQPEGQHTVYGVATISSSGAVGGQSFVTVG